jgi:hypothetical protein
MTWCSFKPCSFKSVTAIFRVENRGNNVLWDVGSYLPDYLALCLKTIPLYLPLWEPDISHSEIFMIKK